MWRMLLVGVVMIAVTLFGFSLVSISGDKAVTANTLLESPPINAEGFARAESPKEWNFPQDFGAHPQYQTEWWYYTGNLTADSGERFGFQFTIFRRAIAPTAPQTDSEWRSNQIYMVHFTISDINNGKFYHDERYSRGSADLAGATGEPYRVWIEDWVIEAQNADATQTTIRAQANDFAIDLALEQVKPTALQGNNGLSAKSNEIGNASYYYSLTRLLTQGTISIGERVYSVSGVSWKDHEFGTSALGKNAQGWDWFGLIFDDNTELMIGQIRLSDGGKEPAFGGMYVYPDGSTRYLPSSDFTITPTDTWTSPHTGAVYPSGWEVTVNSGDVQLAFTITPFIRDQELYGSNVEYWEGAVQVTGDVTGVGYAELTGYVDTMQGRF
jgi:predicted secreted hydrolase